MIRNLHQHGPYESESSSIQRWKVSLTNRESAYIGSRDHTQDFQCRLVGLMTSVHWPATRSYNNGKSGWCSSVPMSPAKIYAKTWAKSTKKILGKTKVCYSEFRITEKSLNFGKFRPSQPESVDSPNYKAWNANKPENSAKFCQDICFTEKKKRALNKQTPAICISSRLSILLLT